MVAVALVVFGAVGILMGLTGRWIGAPPAGQTERPRDDSETVLLGQVMDNKYSQMVLLNRWWRSFTVGGVLMVLAGTLVALLT